MARITDFREAGFSSLLEELQWRGLVSQSTDRERLAQALNGEPITYYCGFDPTAASLHIGNLVQLINMRHLQLAGHHPIALVGGATGLIGDPRQSGERTLNPKDVVAGWAERLKKQIGGILDTEGSNPVRFVSNYDWTAQMSVIDFLRDVGKNFRLGTMLAKDTVARRLNSEEGISFTEFSYQVLQGNDFLHLFDEYHCTLELGGSDQWGNLTSGLDLIHKVRGVDVNVFTSPIITDAQGKKFGKSEGNAVWLDPNKTSPFEFYQYWRNVGDSDVMKCIRMLTFLPLEQIDEMSTWKDQRLNEAKEILAFELTKMVHGEEEAAKAQNAARALFSGAAGDAEHMPNALVTEADLTDGSFGILPRMVKAGLAASNGEARRLVVQGGVLVDGEKVAAPTVSFTAEQLSKGIVIKKGKKVYHKVSL